MERITSWLWRTSQKEAPQEGSYWFDPEKEQMVVMKKVNGIEQSDAVFSVSDVLNMYAARGYDRLQKHSKHAYDFLIARGFTPTLQQLEN